MIYSFAGESSSMVGGCILFQNERSHTTFGTYIYKYGLRLYRIARFAWREF